jgi:hypothetical protein
MADIVNGGAITSEVVDPGLRLIRDAIAMVAAGGAPRVVVAGIGFSEHALDQGRRLAVEANVRMMLLERADGAGVDVAIERIRE